MSKILNRHFKLSWHYFRHVLRRPPFLLPNELPDAPLPRDGVPQPVVDLPPDGGVQLADAGDRAVDDDDDACVEELEKLRRHFGGDEERGLCFGRVVSISICFSFVFKAEASV